MLKTIAAVVTLATAAAPAAAQAVWDARDLGGGSAEFRLGNDEGAVIILVCQLGGISAGFEFPGSLDAAESASIRGVPGERQNVAVAPVNDRVLRLTSGRGLETLLRLLRKHPQSLRARGRRAGVLRGVRERPGRHPVPGAAGRGDTRPDAAVPQLPVTSSVLSSV